MIKRILEVPILGILVIILFQIFRFILKWVTLISLYFIFNILPYFILKIKVQPYSNILFGFGIAYFVLMLFISAFFWLDYKEYVNHKFNKGEFCYYWYGFYLIGCITVPLSVPYALVRFLLNEIYIKSNKIKQEIIKAEEIKILSNKKFENKKGWLSLVKEK